MPAYSPTSNAQYEQLEDRTGTWRFTVLVATTQSQHTGLPAAATAGVMTTRAASEAFFVDGTNRAMFRFTMMNHMCRDMEQVQDTSLPPDRIRQDVSRSPGGDSRMFLNNCIGCHSGMDPLAQAFAYYDYDKTAGQHRLHRRHRAAEVPDQPGQLQAGLSSRPTTAGTTTGARARTGCSAGAARCRAAATAPSPWARSSPTATPFAQCQVEKVFKTVCFRPPANAADRDRGHAHHQQVQDERLPA